MTEVLNSAKACVASMGDVELVRILGTDDMPHKPTELEAFVNEIAAKYKVQLKTEWDGMQVGSWMYCYSRKGKKGSFEINYDFLCFAAQEGEDIPVEQAVSIIKENLAKGEFEENLQLENGHNSLLILAGENLGVKHGDYSVHENHKWIGDYDFKKLRILISQVF